MIEQGVRFLEDLLPALQAVDGEMRGDRAALCVPVSERGPVLLTVAQRGQERSVPERKRRLAPREMRPRAPVAFEARFFGDAVSDLPRRHAEEAPEPRAPHPDRFSLALRLEHRPGFLPGSGAFRL